MTKINVRGSRVVLNCPPRKDLGLHLSAEAQQELLIQELKQMNPLEVYAVGDSVKDIQVGDKVYVSPSTIMHAELVTINGEERFLIREMDIAIIW
jgi:histidinol phosphatase-like enzyme